MTNKLVGILIGLTLSVGIAIGDVSEPVISVFTNRMLVSVGASSVMRDVTVSIPPTEKLEVSPLGSKTTFNGFWVTQPSVVVENIPGDGVTMTIYLGRPAPSFLGFGLSEVRRVRVVRPCPGDGITNSTGCTEESH